MIRRFAIPWLIVCGLMATAPAQQSVSVVNFPSLSSAHAVSAILTCSDTSGSGTVQVCNTSPSFNPVANDCIVYTTTTANTGTGLTVNVNSLGAKSVAKWLSSTTLAANDVLASKEQLLCYDGTNWELATIGNPPAGGVISVNTLTGAVAIKAATAGQVAISGGSGAALTGAADMTYSTHTFATTANGIFDWSAATGAASLKFPAVVGGTQLSGTSTANLSAPMVIQNTNSGNNNTSITLGITAPGTSTGQTVLNVNGASTGGHLQDWGTGGTWASGVLSGQTIVASVLPTGGFVSGGTTAGFIDFPQGTTSASVAPCNTATSICIQAPTSVTAGVETLAGALAPGLVMLAGSSSAAQESHSGDTAHAVVANTQTGAITTATLCAATAGTACGQAGQYRISFNFWGSGTACSAVTAGSVPLNITWTDEAAHAHTTIPFPLYDQYKAVWGNAFYFNTALTTESAQGSMVISTNGTIIQYATTYTGCTTGTGTYNLRATVEQLQ